MAVGLTPIMHGLTKQLTMELPAAQVTWGRFAFNCAIILPFVLWRYGRGSMSVPNLPLQLLRSICMLGSAGSAIFALSYLPIAETLALAFVYPLIVTALSPVFLGESVGWRRYAAVIIGFCGALIVIQPGSAVFQPTAVLGLIPGCFFAAYIILTRQLAGSVPAPVVLAYGAVVGVIIMSASMPLYWVETAFHHWGMFAAIGLIASISHLLMIIAYESGPASLLAPLGYAEMPAAVVVGYVWFGDLPTPVVWLGIVIIVGSGVFISWRETRRK